MNMYEMISGMKAPTTPAVDERTAESISVFFRPGGDGDVDHYYLWNGDASGGDDDGDNGGVPYDIDNTNHKWGVYKNNEVTYYQYYVQIINHSWPILYQI